MKLLESEFFRRIEKKYKLTKEEYEKMKLLIDREFNEDKHGMSTICNLYFDSDDFILVRRSIEKPIYKEKVRLRSYQVPSYNSNVYLEIKKKYKGIVNKRRIVISTEDMKKYLNDECEVKGQVFKEIDYIFKRYDLKPKVFIAYDRMAYFSKENPNLRITFDFNIRYRTEDVGLENGDAGHLLLNDSECIMEIKTLDNLPYEFARYLSTLNVYPTTFSKYGNVYKKINKNNEKNKEEFYV